MSADDLIRDPATIARLEREIARLSDDLDEAEREWGQDIDRLRAAIAERDAIGRQRTAAGLRERNRADAAEKRLEQAESRINDLLTERDELRASVTEYEGSLQAAQSRLARVAALADEWEADALGTDRYCAAEIRLVLGVQR